MAHREDIRAFFKDVSFKGKAVIDWGCGTKPIKNYIGGAKSYYGIDKLAHVGADLVANIDEPMMLDAYLKNPADVAVCLEVLEHVRYPNVLILNIARHLIRGGKLYLSVPFLYPVHSEEDYWRYTDQGVKFLLKGKFEINQLKPTDKNMGWVVEATKIV